MQRFFGMMPSSEVEVQRIYRDSPGGLRVILQAGPNGWSLIFADGSSQFKDEPLGTEENCQNAYKTLVSIFPDAVCAEDQAHVDADRFLGDF